MVSVNSINGSGHITNYVTCASGCFCVTKTQVHRHLLLRVFAFLTTQRKMKLLKDEKKHHGAVEQSSLEQQFHKLDTITFVVLKMWSHTPSASGSYGRQPSSPASSQMKY